MTRTSPSLSCVTTSTTQTLPKLSQASTSTPRAPSSDHNAISTAPVSEPGTMATRKSLGSLEERLGALDGKLEKRLALFRPVRAAEKRAPEGVTDQPGCLAARAAKKKRVGSRTHGRPSGAVICLPFQIDAPRWGGVAHYPGDQGCPQSQA